MSILVVLDVFLEGLVQRRLVWECSWFANSSVFGDVEGEAQSSHLFEI
jgi:hypothetical protein